MDPKKKVWKKEKRRKERENIGKGRAGVTTAITSSEMHLDRVSICQNKAASTADSLMAVDVSDRGEEKWEGGNTHTHRHTHSCT